MTDLRRERCLVHECRHGAARSLFLTPGVVQVASLDADVHGQRLGGLCVEHSLSVGLSDGEGWLLIQRLTQPETVALLPPSEEP